MIVSLSRSVVDLWQRRAIVKKEQERLVLVEQRHQELTERLKTVQTPAFVEKEARERLGMAREGDTVIIMDNMGSEKEEQGGVSISRYREPVPNWKRWWQVFF